MAVAIQSKWKIGEHADNIIFPKCRLEGKAFAVRARERIFMIHPL